MNTAIHSFAASLRHCSPTGGAWLLAGICVFLSLTLSSNHTAAEESSLSNGKEVFLPDTYYLRNPFRTDEESSKVVRVVGTTTYGMDDDDLARAVANLHDHSMSTSHRLLNHQWLSVHDGESKLQHGGRALSEIFMTGFKTFWDSRYGDKIYKGTLMRDKHGNYYQEMDYRIRLSDDSVKMSLEYSF